MMANFKSNRLPPRPLPPQSPDFSRPSRSPSGQRLPSHKKNTLSFEEEGLTVDASSHKRATSDCTATKPPVNTEERRLRQGAGSVFRLASALGESSLTTESSQMSVEVIVSELENPSEPGEDMSETEKTIRTIIQQRGGKPTPDKPLDLQDCISTIITQRQAALKKQEDERWRLKQQLLSVLAQTPASPMGRSFDLEEPVPEFNEYVREVKVAPYQLLTDKRPLKENSFREKSPNPEESKESRKRSNKRTIKIALGVCLPGENYRKTREEAIAGMSDKPGFFLIALRGSVLKPEYAAIYRANSGQSQLEKVAGGSQLPAQLSITQITACYRFESISREFRPVSLRGLYGGVDAILLRPSV